MKARFENNPVVEQLQARNWLDLVPRYRLVCDLRFTDSDGTIHIAPAGMETDGASVIRWLIWLIAVLIFALGIWTSPLLWIIAMSLLLVCTRSGPWFAAACIHDHLGSSWKNNSIFYRAMRASNVCILIAAIYWLGPTLFGKIYHLYWTFKHNRKSQS